MQVAIFWTITAESHSKLVNVVPLKIKALWKVLEALWKASNHGTPNTNELS